MPGWGQHLPAAPADAGVRSGHPRPAVRHSIAPGSPLPVAAFLPDNPAGPPPGRPTAKPPAGARAVWARAGLVVAILAVLAAIGYRLYVYEAARPLTPRESSEHLDRAKTPAGVNSTSSEGCTSTKAATTEPCAFCKGLGRTRSGPCLRCERRGYNEVSQYELDRPARAEENQRRIARGEEPIPPGRTVTAEKAPALSKPVSGQGPPREPGTATRALEWVERTFGRDVALLLPFAVCFAGWAILDTWGRIARRPRPVDQPPAAPPTG